MNTEIVGWLSSMILLLTISKQIHEQWRKGTSKGVSPFLFIGQIAASAGFLVYSVMTKSMVFIVTNALMMVSAAVGLALVMTHRRRGSRRASSALRGARGQRGSGGVFADGIQAHALARQSAAW